MISVNEQRHVNWKTCFLTHKSTFLAILEDIRPEPGVSVVLTYIAKHRYEIHMITSFHIQDSSFINHDGI